MRGVFGEVGEMVPSYKRTKNVEWSDLGKEEDIAIDELVDNVGSVRIVG
jgi:hypothetical protein